MTTSGDKKATDAGPEASGDTSLRGDSSPQDSGKSERTPGDSGGNAIGVIPQKLGKYEIHRKLGQGGMGVVYAGYDRQIERRVALKTINSSGPNQTWVKDLLRRLRREAQAAGRLQHPNIVSVYEFGEEMQQTEDGKEICLSFIAMEFVDGRELKSDLDACKSFSIAEIVNIMGQLLDALGYSHVNGVVHRDIKPANILLMADGRVKVADFGIARIESSTLTQAGSTMGTPTYMSPEQFNKAETVDERADIYSAGVVLYELLTGEVPFDGSTPAALQHRVLNERPSPPSALNPDVPRAFDAVVQRALAKQPAERFASALEFKQAIQAAAGNTPAPTVTTTTSTLPFFARPMVRWASVLGFALAVIGGGGFAAYSLLDADEDEPIVVKQRIPDEPEAPQRDVRPSTDATRDGPRLTPAVARGTEREMGPGTLLISSVGLIESWNPQMAADKQRMEDLVRSDARRRLMTKAAALYVEPESLQQHDAVVGKQLMARTGELIKTVFEEGQRQDRDGRPLADLRAAVKVREVQKLLNDIAKKERIELVRNSGKPKIAVVVRSSGDSGEPQRSAQAENILKAQLQSYGFAIFSNEVTDDSLDFRVDSEVKLKKLSHRLPESGITIEKFTLTSWTVRAVDVRTKEEIYLNTEIPEKQSWATEEQALQAVGKWLAGAFPRNFFLQYYDYKPQRIRWQFRGVPDDVITAVLFEMKGMVQVLNADVVTRGVAGTVIETEMSGMADADTTIIAETLLQPLNRKAGERCFGYGGIDNSEIRIDVEASCTASKALSRFASTVPTVS